MCIVTDAGGIAEHIHKTVRQKEMPYRMFQLSRCTAVVVAVKK
jgi:hypothetical protein